MIKYYKQLNENGRVGALFTYEFEPTITDPDIIEITKEEYATALAEIHEKTKLANQLYYGEITVNDVPEEWQEEIQQRVDKLIAKRGEYTPSELELKAQAYDIITGVSE